jgi:uncharacterized protein (DUF1697 family)
MAYQASGNLVIRADTSEKSLVTALEDGLEAELGYAVPTFVRSAADLRRLAGSKPFDDRQLAASKGKRQVVLLREAPADRVLAQIHELVPDGEVVLADGRDLHWLPAAGLSDSPIDLRRLDSLTGGTTIRTHGTLQRMAAKFLDDAEVDA